MGWMKENDLVFVVSDDGVGIPPEVLPTILDGTNRKDTGSNIAIFITQKRLQLYYGNEYGLTYRSTEGVETEVEIRSPAKPFQGIS